MGPNELAARRKLGSSSPRSGRGGLSHFQRRIKMFAHYRSALPVKSRPLWVGHCRIPSACWAAGKWRLPTAKPYFAMTSESLSMGRQPRWSMPTPRSWPPNGSRSWRRARQRGQEPRWHRPLPGSRSLLPHRRPRPQSNCAPACAPRCCAGALSPPSPSRLMLGGASPRDVPPDEAG
jgi:hypothetical protein